jgi:hypothetical protein
LPNVAKFVALAEPGKKLAGRLEHIYGRALACMGSSVLVLMLNAGHGDVVPELARDSTYVYVEDARNGFSSSGATRSGRVGP